MRKQILTLGIVVLTCLQTQTRATVTSLDPKDSTYFKNHIKLVELGLLLGSYTISYERSINLKNSIDIHIGYRFNTGNVVFPLWYSDYDDYFDWKIQGYVIVIGYRYYLSDSHNFRPFVSPFIRHCHLNEITYWDSGSIYQQWPINSYATGTTFGGQLMKSRITFDVFFGPQIKRIDRRPTEEVVLPWEDYDQQLADLGHNLYLSFRFGLNLSIGF